MHILHTGLFPFLNPFNSQDLVVNSPLQQLDISWWISQENLVSHHNDDFYLLILSILITWLLAVRYYREKLYVNHFWELKG